MQVSKPFAMLGVGSLLVLAVAGFVIFRQFQAPDREPLPLVLSMPAAKTPDAMPVPQATAALPPSRNATEAPAPVAEGPEVFPEAVPPLVPEPVLPPVASAPAPAAPVAILPAPAPVPPRASVDSPAPSTTAPVAVKQDVPPVAPTAGSLARLTAARAQLSEIQVQVQIEEQLAKLRGLQTPQLPAALALPSLPPLPVVPQGRGEGAPARQQGNRVVAVSGVAGNVVATVQTAQGARRVRVGDAFDGGRVEAISRDGVTIRQGGRTQTILFRE